MRDAVTTAVFGNQLMSVVEEMTMATVRSAYSPNIKERFDCASAIVDESGQILAQTDHTPVHLGAMRGLVLSILERHGNGGIAPGDIFIGNDPYLANTVHLNDVSLAAPVFNEDNSLVAFVTNTAHHADIGGRVPGGEAFDNLSIFEEGLRLPPVHIFHEGTLNEAVADVFVLNSRNGNETRGDLRAQIATCRLGVRRLGTVLEAYGVRGFRELAGSLLNASETSFRAAIGQLPDGRYSYEDHIDSDWVTDGPVPIRATLVIDGDSLEVDLRDNPPQVLSGRNVPPSMLVSTILFALKSAVDPSLPPNSGYFRAVTITSNPGTIVNAVPPAAVSVGPWTCQRIADAIHGAFAIIQPERMSAASTTVFGMQIGGWDHRRERYFLDYERYGGGFGARATQDGLDGIQCGITNTSNLPIEVVEAEYPLLVHRYQVITDSGGAGRYRGGLGVRRDVEILAEEVRLSAQGERFVVAPWGLAGGAPGAVGSSVLNPGTEREQSLPPAFSNLRVGKGDVYSVQTPGGGGYGDPRQRGREMVEEDVRNGRVSRQAAEDVYGVRTTERSERG